MHGIFFPDIDEEESFSYNYKDGPYLIWTDRPNESITVIWLTDRQIETEFEYGRDLTLQKKIADIQQKYIHRVDLTNLKSNHTYFFRIPYLSTQIFNFTTTPNGIFNFSFSVLGDTQNKGGLTETEFSSVIETMNLYKHDFVIHTGDTCHSGIDLDSWHIFFESMEKQFTLHPYLISVGNHEYYNDPSANTFRSLFPYNFASEDSSFYSLSYGNAHFVVLDCYDKVYNPLGLDEYITAEQITWLEKELAENQDKWLFVVLHGPPLSTGSFNYNEKLIDQLLPLFYESKVDVVLSGHNHHYEAFLVNRTEFWGGTYYFVTGGGGGGLSYQILNRKHDPWQDIYHNASENPYQQDYFTLNTQLYGELTHHFLHFEIMNQSLNIKAIREDNSLIQTFRVKK